MTPERQALSVDLSLAIAAVILAILAGGTPLSGGSLLIAGAGAVAFAGVLAVAERTDLLGLINRSRPMSLVLAVSAFIGVGVALIAGQGVVAAPSANLLWGVGVGLGGYRLKYGVVDPMPEKRRKQAEMWGMPPEAEELESD